MNTKTVVSVHENESAGSQFAPSEFHGLGANDIVGSRPFQVFGQWRPPVRVTRQGTDCEIAAWLSIHEHKTKNPREAWRRCEVAKPECFAEYEIVKLHRPSFFLPAAEVAFEVITNPTVIPDDPPRGVMMRHLEAMEQYPDATFYFLRPLFMNDGQVTLCLADMLREEAEEDRDYAMFLTKLFGSSFRSAAWWYQRLRDTSRLALRCGTSVVRQLNRSLDRVQRDRQRFFMPRFTSHHPTATEEFRRSLVELRNHLAIDPILCFERPSQPGVLWFEAHWYIGIDGKTYVHF